MDCIEFVKQTNGRFVLTMHPKKHEIMQRAMELFTVKGITQTPVQDIMQAAGISKGGFYHHFISKNDLIDQIISGYVDGSLKLMQEITDEPKLNAIEKYNYLLRILRKLRTENREMTIMMFEMFEKEENLIFKHRYQKKINELVFPIIIGILEQGVEEELFHISDVNETAFLMLETGTIYRAKIARLFLEIKNANERDKEVLRLAQFLQETLEKLLGAKRGSLKTIVEFKRS